jgi:uncharacterized protein YbaR (Trm112 family)
MRNIHPEVLGLMACPKTECRGALRQEENRLVCEKCARRYRLEERWAVMISEEAESTPDGNPRGRPKADR